MRPGRHNGQRLHEGDRHLDWRVATVRCVLQSAITVLHRLRSSATLGNLHCYYSKTKRSVDALGVGANL